MKSLFCCVFWGAHLSKRLKVSLENANDSVICRPFVGLSTFTNIFSSETTGLVELNSHIETSVYMVPVTRPRWPYNIIQNLFI